MKTEEYLTTEQVANLYPFYNSQTLKTMRYRNNSPFPFYKVRGNVRYKKSEIENIINSNKIVDIKE